MSANSGAKRSIDLCSIELTLCWTEGVKTRWKTHVKSMSDLLLVRRLTMMSTSRWASPPPREGISWVSSPETRALVCWQSWVGTLLSVNTDCSFIMGSSHLGRIISLPSSPLYKAYWAELDTLGPSTLCWSNPLQSWLITRSGRTACSQCPGWEMLVEIRCIWIPVIGSERNTIIQVSDPYLAPRPIYTCPCRGNGKSTIF